MLGSGHQWLRVCTLLTLLHVCQSQTAKPDNGLTKVSNVALDKTQVTEPYTLKGVCATFINKRKITIQVWSPLGNAAAPKLRYKLMWQYTLSAKKPGRQKISLDDEYYYDLKRGDMVGIYNPELPGPIAEVFNLNSTVVLSVDTRDETDLIPSNVGTTLEFDGLPMPFQIPVYLCSKRDCEDCDKHSIGVQGGGTPGGNGSTGGGSNRPTGGGNPGDSGRSDNPSTDNSRSNWVSSALIGTDVERVIQTPEFMIGMIAWNIVLTLLIFILMCVIMCILNDNEKRNRRERRLAQHRSWEGSTSWSTTRPSSTGSAKHLTAIADETY